MSFFGQGNNLITGFGLGINTSPPGLKDYRHASKVFRPAGYNLAPKFKFLFQVYFNINTQIPSLQNKYGGTNSNGSTIGLMVKQAELPKFKMNTTTLNQYNRKRLVQSKINYDPVRIVLHDDQSNMVGSMWYDYYNYYYKDSSYKYQGNPTTNGTNGQSSTVSNGFDYNASDIYNSTLINHDWGFVGESPTDGTNTTNNASGKPNFFRDITIYGLYQKKYVAYTLINPIISQWSGDTYDYNEGAGIMQNDMTIEFETVKYYTGNIGAEQPSIVVPGFADPAHYDVQPSGITRPGAATTVFDGYNIVDAKQGSTQDLTQRSGLQNVIGAVQTAATAYNTWNNLAHNQNYRYNIGQRLLKGALADTVRDVRQVTNSPVGMVFPRAAPGAVFGTNPNNIPGGGA